MLSQESVDSTDRGSSLVMDNDDTSSVRSFSTASLHLLEVPLTIIPLALCRRGDAWSSHERFVMKKGGSLLEMRWWSVQTSLLHTLNCLVMSGQSSSRKMKSLEKIWERRKESKFHLMPPACSLFWCPQWSSPFRIQDELRRLRKMEEREKKKALKPKKQKPLTTINVGFIVIETL